MQCSNQTESASLSSSPQHLSPRPFSFSNDQLAQASQTGLIVILSSFYVVRHFRLSILLRHSPFIYYCDCYISSVTSVNLKKAGMANRNIVIKNNTRCFKSALQQSLDFSFLFLYILADLISFLEIQRLQLAGSSSTVFAANSIPNWLSFTGQGRGLLLI